MAPIEVSAPDIESAIAQGLAQLNLIRAEVKIEVIDEGARGLLGIGAKPARVRLTPFAEVEQPQPAQVASQTGQTATVEAESIDASRPQAAGDIETDDEVNIEADIVEVVEIDIEEEAGAPSIEGEDLAEKLTQEILSRMKLRGFRCEARSIFPDNSEDEPSIYVDVQMERDEDLLLGHQHEGLNALQTVVQTMWSHQTKSSLRVNVDVNGYRARREQQLINMARRLAARVAESGKTITLEPMPPNERRIVHIALRDEASVYTESTGQGGERKVQIKPKK
jgi:spoIIIJ-associated protein